MGAWGTGVFENDPACDFAADVADGGGLRAPVQALDRVLLPESDYLRARRPRACGGRDCRATKRERWPADSLHGKDRRLDRALIGADIRRAT
jgi:hypothetical protein